MEKKMTPIEWITLAQIALTVGSAVAEKVLSIRDRLTAGEEVPREEMLGILRQLDYGARVPNSLLSNPVLPPSGS